MADLASGPSARTLSAFRDWQYWAQLAEREDDYLIDGLIHGRAGMVTGRPFVGKTTFAAGGVAAVAGRSATFLGRAVQSHGSVMIAVADPGEERAWGKRMKAYDLRHSVQIAPVSAASWDEVISEVSVRVPRLFVLDNILGMFRGDVRDNHAAKAILNRLDDLIRQDVSVLAIHHSSAKVLSWFNPLSALGSALAVRRGLLVHQG